MDDKRDQYSRSGKPTRREIVVGPNTGDCPDDGLSHNGPPPADQPKEVKIVIPPPPPPPSNSQGK